MHKLVAMAISQAIHMVDAIEADQGRADVFLAVARGTICLVDDVEKGVTTPMNAARELLANCALAIGEYYERVDSPERPPEERRETSQNSYWGDEAYGISNCFGQGANVGALRTTSSSPSPSQADQEEEKEGLT